MIGDLVLLIAQQPGHGGGLVEGAGGVVERLNGTNRNLLIVALARHIQAVGVKVEGDGSRAETEWIEPGIRRIHGGLEAGCQAGQFIQIRHRGAVHDLHP